MKKKTYKILKMIPIVNAFLPLKAISIFGSEAIGDGTARKVKEYIDSHPELKDEFLSEKLATQILRKMHSD